MGRLIVLLIALIVPALPAAAAQAPKPETLLQEMKAWLEPAKSSTRHLVMTVRSAPGDAVEWKAGQARGTVDGSNFSLTVLLEPADVRGTALLIQEQNGKPNSEWLYLPYLRRVRRVLPVDEFQSFLNTEFTDSDMGFVNVHNRKVTLLGSETLVGADTYQLQEIPDDQRTFKRIVTWLAKDTRRPIKREYYDVANRLWKVESFEEVATVHDTPTAQRVRMEDVQTGYGSEYRIKDLGYDVLVPKELFDWQQLPKAADHPVWK
jgi:outer membrane lipoprotein-sorting protein